MTNYPSIEKLVSLPGQSFLYRKIVRNHRPDQRGRGIWHYHPEYELTLTLKSKGNRFIGYNIEPYQELDFVLVGPNIPHCWTTDEPTEQLVINFNHDLLVSPFTQISEWSLIHKMLNQSKLGIKFSEKTAEMAKSLMLKIGKTSGFESLHLLFELLNLLSHDPKKEMLTFHDYKIKDHIGASNRIETIYSYIHKHYKEDSISVAELSEKLNLTKSSLARFVKRITRKSFTDLVIEARLNEACRLLSETDLTIAELSFKSGFNNLSNFNRAFKKKLQMTPKAFRQMYRSDLIKA